jgi:hypothetical protein
MVRRLIFPGRSYRQIQGGSSTCKFDRLVLTSARPPFTWWHLAIRARCCFKKKFTQNQLIAFTANMHTCMVGMESCSGAHFLGRALREQGHDARLIAWAGHVSEQKDWNKNENCKCGTVMTCCMCHQQQQHQTRREHEEYNRSILSPASDLHHDSVFQLFGKLAICSCRSNQCLTVARILLPQRGVLNNLGSLHQTSNIVRLGPYGFGPSGSPTSNLPGTPTSEAVRAETAGAS